ncbi:MAG: 16S rRNA (cytosine(1402)-N(4))-methyltransferase RsmH [Lachnospiraceae bacterium]|nr:16S rRNA (cytosine(1402)-N(4))-methyltransferase RsmH [Lachnospiraceae bacterium]
MEFSHKPVLLDETIEGLDIKKDGIYVDGTLGGAGHSSVIVSHLESGHLYGIDQDEDAIRAATDRLDGLGLLSKVTIVRDNYVNFGRVLDDHGVDKVDGILIDIGVSSYQLDTADRGFSYNYDGPLDMRMDKRRDLSAYEVVNEYDEDRLYRIIRDYGEDRFARNIAKHICMRRAEKPIATTFELSEVIKEAIPAKIRFKGSHPAKQTFQAIRIEVNGELDVLSDSIEGMIKRLKVGGRLCVITFHSLEDRIVKQAFKKAANPCTCPPRLPVCVCGAVSLGFEVNRKPIVASEEELAENPRSKSAKLRVFERV